MPYDERLAERVRTHLGKKRFEEKKMFGGLAFMRRGHMMCGVNGDDLMVRVEPEAYPDALRRTGARPMDFTGRPLKGMLFVGKPGLRTARALGRWVDEALAFVDGLPPKKPPKPRAR